MTKKTNTLIPEIRFPEFVKEGEWLEKNLGSICDVTNGKANAQDHVEDGNFPLFDRSAVIKATNNYIFDCEAVIIPGEGMRFVPKYYEGKFNLHQRAYALKDFTCIGQFVYFSMLHRSNLISQKAVQSTVLSLRLPILQNFPIQIPKNSKEQQKIASCLSSLDELIAAHSQKLDTLKNHKKGLMQNLFPQEGETVPKYRFPQFVNDGEWMEKIFDDILDITRLAGYEYSEYWEEDPNKEIIALRGYNIGKGKLLLNNLGFISNELSLRLIRSRLFKGDIVYPCVGTIGNAVVIEEDNKFHIQQNIAKLTPKADVSPYFISQFLMSELGLREVNKFNATSSQPNVLVGSLRNFKICFPKIKEQEKIAYCLSSLDALITAQADKIEQLNLHKKGLMQGLFPKVNE